VNRIFIMRVKLLFLAALLLTACAPYKMDIRQGNLITPETRERLKIGMTRTQVSLLLGSPLVSDPFHPNRWDYVYSLEQGKKLVTQQRMTLYFEGVTLARIDNGTMPPLPAAAVEPAAQEGK
jgi:outer membrane protein assembly factor BamE